MGSGSSRANAGPPAWLDSIVQRLFPPAAREATVGDLWERYKSPLQFLSEALRVLPFVVLSQARRSSHWSLLGLQAFALFACFGGFAIVPSDPPLWAIASIPTVAAFMGLLWRDVYRTSDERTIGRAVVDVIVVAACVIVAEGVLAMFIAAGHLSPRWIVSTPIAILGALALPVLGVLRFGHGLDGRSPLTGASGTMPFDALARDYARFERRTRWRNRVEIAMVLATIGGSAYFLVRFDPLMAPLGWIMLSGFAGLAIYLSLRGSAQRLPADMGFALLSSLYQSELTRQHRLRSVMGWYWFMPLFVGLAANLIARGLTTGQPLRALLGIAMIALLSECIASLNRHRRRKVDERVTALAQMAERQ